MNVSFLRNLDKFPGIAGGMLNEVWNLSRTVELNFRSFEVHCAQSHLTISYYSEAPMHVCLSRGIVNTFP